MLGGQLAQRARWAAVCVCVSGGGAGALTHCFVPLSLLVLLGALQRLSGPGYREERRGDGLRDYIERENKVTVVMIGLILHHVLNANSVSLSSPSS